MNRIKCLSIAAFAMVFCAGAGTKIELGDGTNVLVDASANVADTFYFATGNVTLKLSGDVDDGAFVFRPSINAIGSGTTVTLDTSELSGCTRILTSGVAFRGLGTVSVGAGVQRLEFGEKIAAASSNNFVHIAVLESYVTFAESGGKVILTNAVSIVRWPSAYEIADGATLCLFGPNLITASAVTLTNYDILIAGLDSVPSGCVFTVPTGRRLMHRPAILFEPSANNMKQWSGRDNWEHTYDIVLTGGRFSSLLRTTGCRLNANISGTGGIIELGGGGGSSLTIAGKIDLSGGMDISADVASGDAANGPSFTFDLEEGSNLGNSEINLSGGVNGNYNISKSLTFKPNGQTFSVNSIVGSPKVYTPVVSVVGGGCISIGSVSKRVVFDGNDGAVNTVSVSAIASDATLSLRPGVRLAAAGSLSAVPVTLAEESGVDPVYHLRGGTSTRVGFSLGMPAVDVGLVVAGMANFPCCMDGVSSLTLEEGADVTGELGDGVESLVTSEGSSFVEVQSDNWKSKVGLWTDASKSSTFVSAKSHVAEVGTQAQVNELADNQIYEWIDWRGGDFTKCIRVQKYRTSTATSYNAKLFPFCISGEEGLPYPYVSWPANGKTRTAFCSGNTTTTLSANCVVAVFSASLGGGIAMMAEKDSKLARADTNAVDGIVANATGLSIATNGVAVADPTATGFTGGWQIVRIVSEDPLSLLGIANAFDWDNASNNGGQRYAEIMIFTTTPSQDEIIAAERYLAKKWNLPIAGGGSASTRTIAVSGSGSVKLLESSTVALGATTGYFAGTYDLNGGRLEIPAGLLLPPSAADVPSQNRLLWVDASMPGAVNFGDDPEKSDEVDFIYARDNEGLLTAAGSVYLTSPIAEDGSLDRRVRFVDGWLRFENGYDDGIGNMLCMKKLPYTATRGYNSEDGLFQFDNVAAGVFALDSSNYGGGSYLLSQVGASGGQIAGRSLAVNAPIVNLGSDATESFKMEAWLDGAAKSPLVDPMSGCGEVLAVGVAEDSNPGKFVGKIFGRAYNTHNYGLPAHSGNEVMGEWMLYSSRLSDDDRATIEAYLMKKWFKRIRTGFFESREMTVSGTGTVSVPTFEAMPALGENFNGEIELARASLDFSVSGDGTVDGVISLDGHALTFSTSSVTVNVSSAKLPSGTFQLISAGDIDSSVSFVLGTVAGAGNKGYRGL